MTPVGNTDVLNGGEARIMTDLLPDEAHGGGAPPDIAWSLAGGERILLQACPIIALPRPGACKVPLPGARVLFDSQDNGSAT